MTLLQLFSFCTSFVLPRPVTALTTGLLQCAVNECLVYGRNCNAINWIPCRIDTNPLNSDREKHNSDNERSNNHLQQLSIWRARNRRTFHHELVKNFLALGHNKKSILTTTSTPTSTQPYAVHFPTRSRAACVQYLKNGFLSNFEAVTLPG